jgi:hypothetical protein
MVEKGIKDKPLLYGCVIPLIVYSLASLCMVGPHLFPPSRITSFGNSPDDACFFLWDFWWTGKALLEQTNPFWTDLLFHPAGTTLTFHNNPLFYDLLSLPFQFVVPGINGLILALNVIIYISFVLSGFGAYRLARHLTGSYSAGLTAGLIYAFMPFHMANMVSLHLLAIEFLPFYVLSLLRLKAGPNWKTALSLSLCLALVYYSSLEYTLFLLLFSGLWLMVTLVGARGRLPSAFIKNLTLSILSFLLIASPLLYQQAQVYASRAFIMGTGPEQSSFWSPALLSFFTPTRYHPLYGAFFSFAGELGDASGAWGMRSEASIGLIPLGLAVVSLFRLKRDRSWFWALAALCFFSLTLGPYLRVTGRWLSDFPLPYLLLHEALPPLRGSRDPTRFLPLAMLMLSMLAAFGWKACMNRFRRSSLCYLASVLLALMVLFEYLPGRAPKFRPGFHPAYRIFTETSGEFAVMDLCYEPFALIQQTFHGKKITSLPFGIPRSPSHALTLPVEKDFRDPRNCLSLDQASLDRRMNLHKADLRRHHIRYAVFPETPLAPFQLKLAECLGAHMNKIQDLFVLEFVDGADDGRSL